MTCYKKYDIMSYNKAKEVIELKITVVKEKTCIFEEEYELDENLREQFENLDSKYSRLDFVQENGNLISEEIVDVNGDETLQLISDKDNDIF